MSKTMNDWSQKELLEWFKDLNNAYTETQKKEIIAGIKKFGAKGSDVWNAEKDDLKEAFEITGLLASKLATDIAKQRSNDLPSPPPNPTDEGNNNNDSEFTLNILGSKPTKLGKIKSSYSIGYVKKEYLTYYGQKITTTKMKGVNIKYLGEPLNDNDRTLKSYGIINGDGIQLFITYNLNGGMSENKLNGGMNENPFKVGQNIQCLDPVYYVATIEKIYSNKIEIRWPKPYENIVSSIENENLWWRVQDYDASRSLQIGDQIICNDTKGSSLKIFIKAVIHGIYTNSIQVDYGNQKYQDIMQQDWSWRIKNFSKVHIKPKKQIISNGSDFMSVPMTKWSGLHSKCWCESLGNPFKKYSNDFVNMDGLQLIDTNTDDLTLIITSGMVRKKLMTHLNAAKSKYMIDDQNTNNNDNDDCKECIIGLNNLGNTCFLNTSIQLISQTPSLSNYLSKRAKSTNYKTANIDNKNDKGKGWFGTSWGSGSGSGSTNKSMLSAWIKLCDEIFNKNKNGKYERIYSPKLILYALQRIDNNFGSGEQDDSGRAMRIMLKALDEEIENEILSKKKKINKQQNEQMNINERNRYIINHSNILKEDEEEMVIQELLRKHNPLNSIIRRLFDGVERVIIECIHCNKIFQQYTTFRDLDVPVINNHITLQNINIIYDKYYNLKQCKLLDYCSIDVLKYEVMNFLKLNDNKTILIDDIEVVVFRNNDINNIQTISSKSVISEICSNSSIFVTVNNKKNNDDNDNNDLSKILECVLFIDEHGNTSKKPIIQYINRNIKEFIDLELEQYSSITDDNKYQIILNGTFLDISKLQKNDYKKICKSSLQYNSLILLFVDKKCTNFHYFNPNNIDIISIREAFNKYPKLSIIAGLNKYKNYVKDKKTISKLQQIFGLPLNIIKSHNDLELNRINNTISELKHRDDIINNIQLWFKKFESSSTSIQKLNTLDECLTTYQEAVLLDNNHYVHRCNHCKVESKFVKLQRKIVYTPPIIILHLDRFNNKNNSQSNSRQRKYSSSDKFKHCVKYGMNISFRNINGNEKQKKYDLYGIANHQGGTSKYGHYTATVKSSNGQWYNISDSSVYRKNVNYALQSTTTATIFMYSNSNIN